MLCGQKRLINRLALMSMVMAFTWHIHKMTKGKAVKGGRLQSTAQVDEVRYWWRWGVETVKEHLWSRVYHFCVNGNVEQCWSSAGVFSSGLIILLVAVLFVAGTHCGNFLSFLARVAHVVSLRYGTESYQEDKVFGRCLHTSSGTWLINSSNSISFCCRLVTEHNWPCVSGKLRWQMSEILCCCLDSS